MAVVLLVAVLAAACSDDDTDTADVAVDAGTVTSPDEGTVGASDAGGDTLPTERADATGFYGSAAGLCRDHQAGVAQLPVPEDARTLRAALTGALDLTDDWLAAAGALDPPPEIAEPWARSLDDVGDAADAVRTVVDGPTLDGVPDDAPLDEVFAALSADPAAAAVESDLANALMAINDLLEVDCFDTGFGD